MCLCTGAERISSRATYPRPRLPGLDFMPGIGDAGERGFWSMPGKPAKNNPHEKDELTYPEFRTLSKFAGLHMGYHPVATSVSGDRVPLWPVVRPVTSRLSCHPQCHGEVTRGGLSTLGGCW